VSDALCRVAVAWILEKHACGFGTAAG